MDSQRQITGSQKLIESATNSPAMFYQFKLETDGRSYTPYVNPKFLNFYEISLEDLQSDPDILLKMIHPDDINQLLEKILNSAANLTTFECSGRIITRSGETKWFHATSAPTRLPDGSTLWYGVSVDMSRQKMLENELIASKRRLELALKSVGLATWDLDTKNDALHWDDTMFELFEVDKDQFTGSYRDFENCLVESDRERVTKELRDCTMERRNFRSEFRIRSKNGKTRVIAAESLCFFDEAGLVNRMIGVNWDVTRVREQETQLLNSSKLSSLGEMAAGIAHEINNPLTIIAGYAQQASLILRQESFDKSLLQKNMDAIEKTTSRISKIISGLHTFAREGEQDACSRVLVKNLIDETLSFCRQRFIHHAIDLRVHSIMPDLEIECRSTQISQVLLNLLNNAFDAVYNLEDARRSVELEVHDLGEEIDLRIIDAGPGIPDALKGQIMQPFFTTKEVGKGMGLGLSVASGIAKSHQGTLFLDAETPRTTFVLRLPKVQNSAKRPRRVSYPAVKFESAPQLHN